MAPPYSKLGFWMLEVDVAGMVRITYTVFPPVVAKLGAVPVLRP